MKVIEFLGMARAGKSTQVDRLEKWLMGQESKVFVLRDRERAQSLATPPDQPMAYQLVFFSRVIEAYFSALKDSVDYFIVDRGFQDASVWADVLKALDLFNEKQREADRECFSSFNNLVHHTFYFFLPVPVAMSRHGAAKDEAVDKVAMNEVWLNALEKAYQANVQEFQNVVCIDGLLSVEEAEQKVQSALLIRR